MKEWSSRPLGTVLFLALMMALVTACAGNSTHGDPVRERAQLRWDSILSGDLDTAYSLYSPGYRSANTRVDFEIELRLQRVKWTSAEYLEQACSEDRCVVSFKVGYRVTAPVPGVSVFDGFENIQNIWVKTGGTWWFVPPQE